MSLPRASDNASKIALGIVALVEVPQVWSQWQPSVSTLRGGDWPGMVQSVKIGSAVAWGYSMALAATVSWIIGDPWPMIGAAVLCGASQFLYMYFVTHPAEDNPRAEMPEQLTKALNWRAAR